jgi:hypothetical protein
MKCKVEVASDGTLGMKMFNVHESKITQREHSHREG